MIKNKYLKHQASIHNLIWRGLQVLGKQGVIFAILILAAKLLDPYTFGVYNYILAIILFLVMFGDFGISTATSKYVAEYNATDKNKLKSVLFSSGIIILGLTIIITILTLTFGKYFLGDKYIYVLFSLPLIFLMPLSSLYDGIYRGLKKFKQLATISLGVGFLSLFFIYFLIKNYGLIGALISQNLFYLILVIALGLGYREFNFKLNKGVLKQIFSYSIIVGFAAISFFLYSKADVLILGHYGFINEIGYYELIMQVFTFGFLPFVLLAQVIAPNITEYFAKKEFGKVILKWKKFLFFIIPLSIIIACLFYFLFPQALKLFLPKYYVPEMTISIFILTFLIPAKIWGVFQTQGFIVSTGFAKINAITTFIGGVLNVILDVVFLKLMGFIGVFLVTLVIHSLTIIVQTIIFKRQMNRLK